MKANNFSKRTKVNASLNKEAFNNLDIISTGLAVGGLSATLFAAIQLSIPAMVVALVAGGASAISKLKASKEHKKEEIEQQEKEEAYCEI